MKQEIRVVRFDFDGKDTEKTDIVQFGGPIQSAFVAMSGFYQKFDDSGHNILTTSAAVSITDQQVNIVNLTATLNIQPANKKSMVGWIDAIVIATLED